MQGVVVTKPRIWEAACVASFFPIVKKLDFLPGLKLQDMHLALTVLFSLQSPMDFLLIEWQNEKSFWIALTLFSVWN